MDNSVILKAISFFVMIAFGYLFKHFGLIKKEFGNELAVISMKFFLPAAIMASFASFQMDYSMLILILFGLGGGIIFLIIGYIITINGSRDDRIYYMVSGNSYNIGNFVLPFVSSFFGPVGIVSTSLFDAGNSVMLLGINCSVTEILVGNNGEKRHGKLAFIQKRLFSAPAFDAYAVMVTLALLNIKLPSAFYSICSEIGKANGPLAMFMIGAMLEIHFDKSYLNMTLKMLLIRGLVSAFLMFIISRLTFLPDEARIAGMIVVWSPIGSASAANTAILGGNTAIGAFVNTMSLLCSLIIIPTLVLLLH